jgi:hypothetical protein
MKYYKKDIRGTVFNKVADSLYLTYHDTIMKLDCDSTIQKKKKNTGTADSISL